MFQNEAGITGIVPFTYFLNSNKTAGSTSIRVDNLTAVATDFIKYKHGHRYDNLIFQKCYWLEMMELFKGPKVLDVCDPDWFEGSTTIIDIADLVHAITCSSSSLTELLKGYLPNKPIFHVPDRFNIDTFRTPRGSHSGKAQNVLWFGFIKNAHECLPQLTDSIKKNSLNLTIISDKPYSVNDEIYHLKPRFIPFTKEVCYKSIMESDIVLNPKSHRAIFKFKSNNKTIISNLLGVPVAETATELNDLISEESRNWNIRNRQDLIYEYDIRNTAKQYREILTHIANSNQNTF